MNRIYSVVFLYAKRGNVIVFIDIVFIDIHIEGKKLLKRFAFLQ